MGGLSEYGWLQSTPLVILAQIVSKRGSVMRDPVPFLDATEMPWAKPGPPGIYAKLISHNPETSECARHGVLDQVLELR